MRDRNAREKVVVTPVGRVLLSGGAATVLGVYIAHDARLGGTSDELDYALIAQVPDSEVESFCEVLGDWLAGMSHAELAEPEMQQLARLLEALVARPRPRSDQGAG